MQKVSMKAEAKRLVESLPDGSTGDDLMHAIYTRQTIEAGLADGEAGRTMSVGDVRAQFFVVAVAAEPRACDPDESGRVNEFTR